MIGQDKIEYQHSLFFFIGAALTIIILTGILVIASYILITQEFYLIIIGFIWLLYGLLFRDAIPKILRTGKNIFSKTPALILTQDFLIDNINGKQFKWEEINSIGDYYDARTGSYIAISVKNHSEYLKNEKSFYDRTIMKLNEKYWNGMFAIRPRELKCNRNELIKNLKSFLEMKNNSLQ